MIENKVRGRVVLVTDVESLAFPFESSGYAGSKCALRGLADSLRYWSDVSWRLWSSMPVCLAPLTRCIRLSAGLSCQKRACAVRRVDQRLLPGQVHVQPRRGVGIQHRRRQRSAEVCVLAPPHSTVIVAEPNELVVLFISAARQCLAKPRRQPVRSQMLSVWCCHSHERLTSVSAGYSTFVDADSSAAMKQYELVAINTSTAKLTTAHLLALSI